MQGSANEAKDSDYIRIGVRAGGASGAAVPPNFGQEKIWAESVFKTWILT